MFQLIILVVPAFLVTLGWLALGLARRLGGRPNWLGVIKLMTWLGGSTFIAWMVYLLADVLELVVILVSAGWLAFRLSLTPPVSPARLIGNKLGQSFERLLFGR